MLPPSVLCRDRLCAGSKEAMGCGTWVQDRRRREWDPQHREEILDGSHPSSSRAVLSIDRVEHPSPSRGTRRYPRYHSNLFRGQDAWDPHTHVLLPSQAPRPSPPEGKSPGVTPGPDPVSLPPKPDAMSPSCQSSPCQTLPLTTGDLAQALIVMIQCWGDPCVLHGLLLSAPTLVLDLQREEIPMLDAGLGSELRLWVLGVRGH